MFHNKLNFVTKCLFVVGFVVLAGISIAKAQAPGTAIKFTAENSFALRGKVFPAGEYTISRLPGSVWSSDLLVLRGESGATTFTTTPTSSLDAAKESAIVFNNIDGINFLSEIRLRGETTGKSINITKTDVQQIAKLTRRSNNADTTGL